ncbi:hypothetical protein ACEYYB_13670 [Paracoccus sp. p4-l81]|uniref:hypothetical protein n=1 Tax=Paracoccus sp. p4-l81 TaxID=3342806 RepID=UPI0035B9F29C
MQLYTEIAKVAGLALLLAGCVVAAPDQVVAPGAEGRAEGPARLRLVDARLMTDAADPQVLARLRAHIAAAQSGAARAMGRSQAAPIWRVCTTPACDQAHGMTTRGLSYGSLAINIGSRAWDDAPTYLHEAIHAEMNTSDLLLIRLRQPVPVWFDEGIATHVSGTVGADLSAAECAALAGRTLPTRPADFTALTREIGFRNAYGAASCRVKDWLAAGRRTQDVIAIMQSGKGLP